MAETPYWVKNTINHIGVSLRGGFIWTGQHGPIVYDSGNRSVRFAVNGKPGQGWKMVVGIVNDEYTVSLIDKTGLVLASAEGIYCENLCGVVCGMYDDAIKAHNQGFIPLD